jgi:tetratricopeptide (TPR) repeat protein
MSLNKTLWNSAAWPLISASLVLTSIISPLAVSQTPPVGKKVALLIGVNKYDKRGFRDLEYAERDVAVMKPLLENAGFEVHLLTASAEEARRATLKNIQATIERVLKDRTKRDLVLVALAGHGLQIEVVGPDGKLHADSFFCPCDAVNGHPKTMLSMGKLFEDINARGGEHNLVLIDACREDPTRGRGMDGSTVRTLPEGVAVLFGCRAGQKTYETKRAGGGHGVFFHFVIEGLRGEAANPRGNVTWARLVEYVTERVAEDAPRLFGDDSLRQTPNLIANLPGISPVIAASVSPPEPARERATLLGWSCRRFLYKSEAQKLGLDDSKGVRIPFLLQEGPAEAGLQTNDVVLAMDGQRVASRDELDYLMKPLSDGDLVRFEVWRNARSRTVEVKLALERGAPTYHHHTRSLAERGNVEAQFCLAVQFNYGRGVTKDLVESAKWYRNAAERGHRDAQNALGFAYERGEGVGQDYEQALAWYRKAADNGDALAKSNIGMMYYKGRGVTLDYGQAMKWFHTAALDDLALAQREVGLMIKDARGVQRDYAIAMKWYRLAADKGFADALNDVGVMYHNGLGVQRDHAEAARWYRKAIARGHELAKENLRKLGQN